MPTDAAVSIRLDQCLFGYDDGHRLLASSLKLSKEAEALLLLHSDLAPNSSFFTSDGYWTGVPIRAAKLYALMKTWPAPEMPRPGCVWTHVLLISFSDMARIQNLGSLADHFRRPSLSANFPYYGTPTRLDLEDAFWSKGPILSSQCTQVLRALYTPNATGIVAGSSEPIEDVIFSIWSQQWPRLRRAFSFRTAWIQDRGSKPLFDLQIGQDYARASLSSEMAGLSPWESAAVDDLQVGSAVQSPFRRFLWRYGSDVRRGRQKFRFLAELFLSSADEYVRGTKLSRILEMIVDNLPLADDGKLLKEDLLSCGESTYSLLPRIDAIACLEFLLKIGTTAFPPVPQALFDKIGDQWTVRSAEILALAETAIRQDSLFVERLLRTLSQAIEPTDFLVAARDYPLARDQLIRANPDLLDSEDILALSDDDVLAILSHLGRDDALADRVLERFLPTDRGQIAEFFANRFPATTRQRVFDSLIQEQSSGLAIPHVWPDVVRRNDPHLVENALSRATTTTAMAALSSWLGLDVKAGLAVPAERWADVLKDAVDDVRGQPRQKLLSYLLALALAKPSPGCEAIFERAFDSIHSDIMYSRLPYDAFDALARYLPDLYWWQQWDTCQRLRLAVTRAYVSAKLDPLSFGRLTSDRHLYRQLVEVTNEVQGGRALLRDLYR